MTTTTSLYQLEPDYYDSIEECNTKNSFNTNPRYKNFRQKHFTAGDEEQFDQYRYDRNSTIKEVEIDPENIFKNELTVEISPLYKNVEATGVLNTFKYIFYKFKKGIFVKIVDNQLKVFLPFSNVNFQNEWASHIKFNPKYYNKAYGKDKLMYNFFKYITESEGYTFNRQKINSNVSNWYGNNSLIRYEFPISESDTNIPIIKNMLDELCASRKIPDIEFFINKRDFPIITENHTEPYYNIFDTKNQPLLSHKYEKYIPILSMSKSEGFADIIMPNYNDWSRIQIKENKWFSKSCINNVEVNCETKWEDKKSIAVFRGSSTGCGVTINTNQRLKAAYLSYIDKGKLLDAGITKWNLRPRKIMGEKYLQTIDVNSLPFKLVDRLTPQQQCQYKYVVHIDGHVSAFRLSSELNMESTILMVESEWKLWYSNLLKPFVHYIPIKNDLSDLLEKIRWCRKNDSKCKEIAHNAKLFYNKYLQKNGVLDYLQKLLIDIKKHTGYYLYNSIKPMEIQIDLELKNISRHLDFPNVKNKDINTVPKIVRCYGLLKGVHYLVNMTNSSFLTDAQYKNKIFENKLGIVNKYTLADFNFAVKTTKDSTKAKEHIHETFIGINCINNIIKQIPNFVYNFGFVQEEQIHHTITEYIEGINLLDYIKSDTFDFNDYLLITSQICLALQVAQNNYNFVHNDLTPWNIMIKKLDKPVFVEYVLDFKTVIKIKTHIVPILIDYGKSNATVDNINYGFINMYTFSSCQDIISYLVTTLFQIIVDKGDVVVHDNIIKLSNFISGTTYCKNTFNSLKDITTFCYNAKKYSNLINSNKHELESTTPLDLFYYIQKEIASIDFTFVDIYNSFMNKGDGTQVFKYILSHNTEQQLQTFINCFDEILESRIKYSFNFLNYYYIQELENKLTTVYEQFMEFKHDNSLKIDTYKQVLDKLFGISLKTKELYTIDEADLNLKILNYDQNIFLLPKKVDELIVHFNDNKYIEYKQVLEYILLNHGCYALPPIIKNNYIEQFNKLLKTKSLFNQASIKTLLYISKIIYSKNLEL